MSLWYCRKCKGLYGGDVWCPGCGEAGDYATIEDRPMIDKNLLRARLAFIRQGSEVERWHTKRMIQRNDVGHHSFHVAWLAYLLALGDAKWGSDNPNPNKVVMAALAHDLAEHYTGDVPGDFKREAGIREQFGAYEHDRFMEVGLEFEGGLNATEKRCLKFADMLEGAFFCISEASLGNARVGLVFRNYRGYIESFAPFNEVEAGIVEYVDELWLHYGVNDAPAWGKTAHSDQSLKDMGIMGQDEEERWGAFVEQEQPRSGLIDALRTEEAEGRATPRPQSNAPIQGDMPVPEGVADDTSDDRATSDLGEPGHMPANARQHGGDHYKGSGYEHWDFVLDTHMNYFQGCATKYVTRARKHEAGCRLNIEKAIHYVDKVEEAIRDERIKLQGTWSPDDLMRYKAANQLNETEIEAIRFILVGSWGETRWILQQILGQCPPQE